MSKKPKRSLLAAVIPTYSGLYNEFDYEFSINQFITQKNTVLDYSFFTCSRVRADVIILICKPEQIPYYKIRYGDAFIDMQYCSWEDIVNKEIRNQRTIPIYYISPGDKYKKFDTEAFNMFYITKLFMKAIDETFGVLCPTNFFYILPYIIISPNEFMRNSGTNRFRMFQDNFQLKTDKSRFQFMTDQNQYLPNLSHTFLHFSDIEIIWDKLENVYKEYKSKNIEAIEISTLTLQDIIEDHRNLEHNFIISNENVFDLRTWKEYIRLISKLEEEKYSDSISRSNALATKYVNNLPNLTYHLSGPIIYDNPYSNKISKNSKKNIEFERWKKMREKLRNNK